MDEAIDGRECHGWIGEDLAPFAERLVGRDQHRATLVTRGDQLEQHAGFGLILGDVGDVVQDQQIVTVELGDGGLQRQFSPRYLQTLHEVGGAREQHAPAVFNQRQAERCRQMALAAAGRPEQQDVGPFSSHASPAASAMTCAFETIGTWRKPSCRCGEKSGDAYLSFERILAGRGANENYARELMEFYEARKAQADGKAVALASDRCL